jgi:Immunoglobulin-like domain of bacterial spore germination
VVTDHRPEDGDPGNGVHHRHRGLLVGIGALVAVAAIAGAVYLVIRDDDGDSTTTSATTTAPATTPPATTLPVETTTAVWPNASTTTRYPDPASAARGFATDYVGFVDPIVGEFRQGDTRSGEVLLQATRTGPTTNVLVRQLGESWFVLGASTPNIELTSPAAGTTIASPVRLQGTSTAFEATVNVQVRAEDVTAPIATGTVMGGANGELGPFDGTIEFSRPASNAGALVLLTISPKDGNVSEATVVRVDFA